VGVELESPGSRCGRSSGGDAKWLGRTDLFVFVGVGVNLAEWSEVGKLGWEDTSNVIKNVV